MESSVTLLATRGSRDRKTFTNDQMLSLEAVPLRVGGGSRDNCPWPSKKLKLSCSAVCCNDTKVKFRRSSFLLADPGPVLALGGPGWK